MKNYLCISKFIKVNTNLLCCADVALTGLHYVFSSFNFELLFGMKYTCKFLLKPNIHCFVKLLLFSKVYNKAHWELHSCGL